MSELTSTSESLVTAWSSVLMVDLGTLRSRAVKVVSSITVDILMDVVGLDVVRC